MKLRLNTILTLAFATALIAVAGLSTSPALAQPDGLNGSNPEARIKLTPSTIVSRDVTVMPGDTLQSIAARELGKAGFAPQLAQFNNLVVNATLVEGDLIRIPIHVPARGEFARVVFVKGDVMVKREAELVTVSTQDPTQGSVAPADNAGWITLLRDADIQSGDTIVTEEDGYVSIEFSTGSVINLHPNTEATLSRLNCLPADDSCVIEIKTTRGVVSSNVETRNNQPVDFRISTPYASAAVRGTVFDFDTADALRVGVTEGLVALSAEQELVDVNMGFGSVVEEGSAPSQPVPLLPAPVFKQVPSRVAPGDAVTWWPFSDAQSYAAQLSTDEVGNEHVAGFDITNERLELASIDSGDYFLLLRAVDQFGLQGFTSNTRVTVAEIDESISPVETQVTREGSEILVLVTDPPLNAAGFEIQVSETDDFLDALSVDVNTNGSAVFRLDTDRVFTRARVLLDPFTVSNFGAVTQSDN